jgi:hypothetical protein
MRSPPAHLKCSHRGNALWAQGALAPRVFLSQGFAFLLMCAVGLTHHPHAMLGVRVAAAL